MNRRRLRFIWCLLAVWILTSGFNNNQDFSQKPEYLKSATYYSDDWVVNFWNSESAMMDQELKKIAEDGFNSIILVVPWREFQPETSPISYNPYALKKFDRVMKSAEKNGLWVQLRIGYTWDYYSHESVLPRYQSLIYQDITKKAWLDYAKTIYERASAFPNFYGGFLTWEDFWDFVDAAATMGRANTSIRMADLIGFRNFMMEHYTLEEVQELYGEELTGYDRIYLPNKESPAFLAFYRFYDEFLNGLLAETQTVFPQLSMEVRLDVDPVPDGKGGVAAADHYATFPCGGAPYTSTMFSVSMGQQNEGETVSAKSVLSELNNYLDLTNFYSGGKPLYVDQLLFVDNTEEYIHNARIKTEELPQFLISAAPILKQKTMGYGIWTYRNYTNNLIYNSQFALGEKEWSMGPGASVVRHNGNMAARLSGKGSQISQNIGTRGGSRENKNVRVSFRADSSSLSTLIVTLGYGSMLVNIKGNVQVDLDFGTMDFTRLTIACDDEEIFIDNVNVYNYEQDGHIYSRQGEALDCLDAVRELNGYLTEQAELPTEAVDN